VKCGAQLFFWVVLASSGASMAATQKSPGTNPAEALEVPTVEVVGTSPLPGLGTPIQDVPANVQIFTSEDLARQRQTNVTDYLEQNPSSVTSNAAQGNPIAVSYPEEGSVLMISGSAIMKDTRHPNAAKLFMEFCYSAQNAIEDVEEFGLPLRRDAVLPAGYKKLDARQYNGSAYGMVASHRGYQRPVGEWNFEEVTVKGSTIRVELNGTLILNADLSKVSDFMADHPHPGKDRTSGSFGFAGHNDPVQFRNIRIKRLE